MKNKTTIVTILLIFFIAGCSKNTVIEQTSTSLNIRNEIRTYIDELYEQKIVSIEHTTDGIEKNKKFIPDDPRLFNAGRFKIVFGSGDNKKTLIAQTEDKVGHISPVTPGKTDIGGYIQIVENDTNNTSGITHTTKGEITKNINNKKSVIGKKLNTNELDYFIRMLYKKFNNKMTEEEANKINKIKDYALAIKFSGKPGIEKYHNKLKKLNK